MRFIAILGIVIWVCCLLIDLLRYSELRPGHNDETNIAYWISKNNLSFAIAIDIAMAIIFRILYGLATTIETLNAKLAEISPTAKPETFNCPACHTTLPVGSKRCVVCDTRAMNAKLKELEKRAPKTLEEKPTPGIKVWGSSE